MTQVIVPDNIIHRLKQEFKHLTQSNRASGRTTEMLKMLVSGDIVVAANGCHKQSLKDAYNRLGLTQDVGFVTYDEYKRHGNFGIRRTKRIVFDHYTVEYLTQNVVEKLHQEIME